MARKKLVSETTQPRPPVRIGLREANQQFARTIALVREGAEVYLTDRGRPVAVVKRFDPENDIESEEEILDRLARRGLVRRGAASGPMPDDAWRPVKIRGRSIGDTLREDRDAR